MVDAQLIKDRSISAFIMRLIISAFVLSAAVFLVGHKMRSNIRVDLLNAIQLEPLIYDARIDGVKGDGGDYTEELRTAISHAGQKGIPLGLPAGTFYVSNSKSIDFSGVPEVIGSNTIIDCSNSSAEDVFSVNGKKTLIRSGLTLSHGDSTIDIKGVPVSFNRGDVLIITSVEPHPNNARPYYFKGTRTYVDSIVGNELRFYPQVDFDYDSSAYFWKITESKFKISGVTFLGNAALNHTGLAVRMANAEIRCDFKYFSEASVRFEISRGTYSGTIEYPYLVGGGNSYGVAIADLSDITVSNSFITGARHAVTIGGGTLDASDSGGEGPAAYPSTGNISHGTYGSSRSGSDFKADPSLEFGAIDAHGIAKKLTVSGATIYGGLKIAAIESAVITGNTIYHHNFPTMLIADSVNIGWGTIVFNNNTDIFIGTADPSSIPPSPLTLFTVGSTVFGETIDISNNLFLSQIPVKKKQSLGLIRNFKNISMKGNSFSYEVRSIQKNIDLVLTIYATKELNFDGNNMVNSRVNLIPRGYNATVRAVGNRISQCAASGFQTISNSLDPSATFNTIYFENNIIEDCYYSGIRARTDISKRLFFMSNITRNNNRSNNKSSYAASGIGIQKINTSDVLELIVLKGNLAVSDTDAKFPHQYGFFIPPNIDTKTNIVIKGNTSIGETVGSLPKLNL